MSRAACGAFILISVCAPGIAAQQATVSRSLARAIQSDTVVSTWLFGRQQYSLTQIENVVDGLGGRLRRRSVWLHAVSADLSSAALRTARQRPEILHLQLVARYRGPRPEAGLPVVPAPAARGAPPIEASYGASAMPLRRLNIFPLAQLGFRGAGIKIAIFDTGFETGLPVFASTALLAQRDFVFNDSVVRNQSGIDAPGASTHGTGTWSLLGANQPGNMIGIAADAQFILAKTEDVRSETAVEEDNWVAAMEWADSLGAKIISSSLGYTLFDNGTGYTFNDLNGDVAVTTRAADIAAQRGITVVNSMGNSGPSSSSMSAPADADSIISVGAVDSTGNLAGFSSRGPTADGRIKPDVTGPGVAVYLATPTGFSRGNGTSFSTPIVAGAAALIQQTHPTFGPIEIRDALRIAGSNARSPDNNQGWGAPDVTVAATFPSGVVLLEPSDSLVTVTNPHFSWSAANVPGFGLPVKYTLTVGRDSTFTNPILDTTLTGTSVMLPVSLSPGSHFTVRVVAKAADSASYRLQPATRYTVTGAGLPAPPITLLFQNFPNPFPSRTSGETSTCIWFDVATAGQVRLDVLDLRGHVVKTFVPGPGFATELPAGRYGRPSPAATTGCNPDFLWDGTGANGAVMPQGIYLIRLEAPDGVFFRRIVYLGR
jgi:hypothetical protein